MSPVDMGTRIKRLRLERHLTQAQLAQRIGVTRVHLANLESPDSAAHHRRPSLATVEKLAQALKVTMAELLGERRQRRS